MVTADEHATRRRHDVVLFGVLPHERPDVVARHRRVLEDRIRSYRTAYRRQLLLESVAASCSIFDGVEGLDRVSTHTPTFQQLSHDVEGMPYALSCWPEAQPWSCCSSDSFLRGPCGISGDRARNIHGIVRRCASVRTNRRPEASQFAFRGH